MPLAISDFIKIPTSFKYIVLFGVLVGATIQIPFSGILLGSDTALGEIFFEPFRLGLEAIGIFVNFQLFVILVVLVGLVLFAITLNGWKYEYKRTNGNVNIYVINANDFYYDGVICRFWNSTNWNGVLTNGK